MLNVRWRHDILFAVRLSFLLYEPIRLYLNECIDHILFPLLYERAKVAVWDIEQKEVALGQEMVRL